MRNEVNRPLIVDSNVIRGLARLCPDFDMDTSRPTAEQYEAYLELCQRWASEWGTEPDVIERLLFSFGKDENDAFVVRYLDAANE